MTWLAAAVMLSLAAGIGYARYRAAAPASPPSEGAGGPVVTAPEAELVDTESAAPALGVGGAGAASAAEPLPFYGFCPTDAAPIARPTAVDLLNTRLSELRLRAQEVLGSGRTEAGLRRGISRLYARPPDPDEALDALIATPDRFSGGFDVAAAAALLTAARALRAGDRAEAARWAREAAGLDEEDAAPHLLLAEIARREGSTAAEREALERAFELAPQDHGAALALGRSLSRTGELGPALRALEVYLTGYPDDAMTAGLYARLEIRADLLREAHHLSSRGVTVWWSREISEDLAERALEMVVVALDRAAWLMGVDRRRELTVFVYDARADMLAVTCAQEWARAVYDGALHLDGSRLSRPGTLRSHVTHETVHAQLADATSDAPVWLHEGLAQYLAEQRSAGHLRSYRFMVEQRTWIPFASLGGTFQVITDSGDARLAYHQSLAMVDLLIERRGERVIAEAVAYLRSGGDPQGLIAHLTGPTPITGEDLLEFLAERLEE